MGFKAREDPAGRRASGGLDMEGEKDQPAKHGLSWQQIFSQMKHVGRIPWVLGFCSWKQAYGAVKTEISETAGEKTRNPRKGAVFMENETAAKRLTDRQVRVLEGMYEGILHAEPALRNFDVEVRITRRGEPSAFPDRETLLVGWDEIAEFMVLHRDTCKRTYGREFRERGITFRKKVRRRPGDQARSYVCTWPTMIMAWSVRSSRTKRADLRRSVLDILRRTV